MPPPGNLLPFPSPMQMVESSIVWTKSFIYHHTKEQIKFMNISLLLKWIWKLYNEEGRLWQQVIKNKYISYEKSILMNGGKGSQFWNGLQLVKSLVFVGAIFTVGMVRGSSFGMMSRVFLRKFSSNNPLALQKWWDGRR